MTYFQILQLIISQLTLYFVYIIWFSHKKFSIKVDEYRALIDEITRHEHKIRILLHTLSDKSAEIVAKKKLIYKKTSKMKLKKNLKN